MSNDPKFVELTADVVRIILLVIGGNEARPQYLQQSYLRCLIYGAPCTVDPAHVFFFFRAYPERKRYMMSESCCCSRRACGLTCGYSRCSYRSSSFLDMMVLPFFSVELLPGRSASIHLSISGVVGFYYCSLVYSVRAKRTSTLFDIYVLYSERKISRQSTS